MSLGVTFRRAARSEFIEAAARYEAQRPGLGATFITEIERCVASAAERPVAYPVVHNDTRRVTAKRFPFSVYFCLEARRIVVWQYSTVGAVRWFGNPGADHTAICTSQEKQRSYAVLSQLVGEILRDHVTLTCESVDRMYLNPAYELYAHEHLYQHELS